MGHGYKVLGVFDYLCASNRCQAIHCLRGDKSPAQYLEVG